jgi:anti-sigma factor RsiW
VTHPSFEAQMDAWLDGELAEPDAQALEAHLGGCPECARFREGRLALRAAIGGRAAAYPAPEPLRDRVRAALRAEAGVAAAPARVPRPVARWLALAATLLLVALGSWRLGRGGAAGDALADQLLAAHLRSLMPGHLTDVLSSDQHTVKPWFNGRLDFSPPVYDFAGRGYPLLGGRLDYVDGRTVAVLVYGRRQHLINVFLWPEAGATGPARAERTRRGYHLLEARAAGYSRWVVSDLGQAELAEFAALLAGADSAAAPAR